VLNDSPRAAVFLRQRKGLRTRSSACSTAILICDGRKMQGQLRNCVTASALAVRNYLSAQGFLEIETPLHDALPRPKGAARETISCPAVCIPAHFLRASRKSPQFVQADPDDLRLRPLLFRSCAAFRDEDLRADRQPEFTQIDLEMTFSAAGR